MLAGVGRSGRQWSLGEMHRGREQGGESEGGGGEKWGQWEVQAEVGTRVGVVGQGGGPGEVHVCQVPQEFGG